MQTVIDHVDSRIAQRMGYMGIACGEPGRGKSYLVIRLGEEIDDKFSADRIAFGPREFLEIVSRPKSELPPRSVVIFEEAGVGIPAREWYSIGNKVINHVLQTIRYRQLVCFFNTPSMSYMDKNTRLLLNAYIEPVHIDFKTKICSAKYLIFQFNPLYGKTYHKYIKEGFIKTKKIHVGIPSEGILEDYERRKQEFAEDLKAKALKEIDNLERKMGINGGVQVMKQTKKEIIISEFNNNLTPKEIAEKYGFNKQYVRNVKYNS